MYYIRMEKYTVMFHRGHSLDHFYFSSPLVIMMLCSYVCLLYEVNLSTFRLRVLLPRIGFKTISSHWTLLKVITWQSDITDRLLNYNWIQTCRPLQLWNFSPVSISVYMCVSLSHQLLIPNLQRKIPEIFPLRYDTLIRPHLDYGRKACSSYLARDVNLVEKLH